MSKSKDKKNSEKINKQKFEKIELSQGGMRSPGNTVWGKILIWFLTLAMLSTGIAFLIYTLFDILFRRI